ncbi:MAG: non-canonical purine NTP pyrophosphatase [Hyphomicrobiaceae bacterium]|nr:non-canonical purine NTP pyrophosphatase [Hyphomicrobiaceae bacterium]
MRKLAPGTRLVVASHNPGKVWEIHQLIAPYRMAAVSARDLGLPEPEETETTFAGNARLKAVAAASASGLPALADDSGLEVAVLGGAPGIYSARWAGPKKDFSIAMARVKGEIEAAGGWDDKSPPRANFISVLCLAWPDGTAEIFEGRVDGHLVWPPRGGNGFGYDPMFVRDGATETFGEMQPAEKYAISHRTRAFQQFKSAMLDGIEPDAQAEGQGDIAGLAAAAANLSTRAELIRFVANLGEKVENDAGEGAAFAEALRRAAAWLGDDAAEDETRWRLVAKMLLAASGLAARRPDGA